MTKNPSRKLPKVFVLIIPQVIQIHFGEWEVVILVVCHPGRGVPVKIPKDAFVVQVLQYDSLRHVPSSRVGV